MNTVITSKEDILNNSRELIRRQGWDSINIRSVAAACGVSVGSIYNYFGSKAELISATIESVWCEIFHLPKESEEFQSIESCISWIYRRMEYGFRKYPGFFSFHSIGLIEDERESGKSLMERTCRHMKDGICYILKNDPNIRQDAFNEKFTEENFSEFLFSIILSALSKEDYDPAIILEVIRRTLY